MTSFKDVLYVSALLSLMGFSSDVLPAAAGENLGKNSPVFPEEELDALGATFRRGTDILLRFGYEGDICPWVPEDYREAFLVAFRPTIQSRAFFLYPRVRSQVLRELEALKYLGESAGDTYERLSKFVARHNPDDQRYYKKSRS